MAKPRERPSHQDRKSTRLNSSHTVIYTLSLHDALPISGVMDTGPGQGHSRSGAHGQLHPAHHGKTPREAVPPRSEEHTSELQSHSDLHSFPTRRSSDLRRNGHRPRSGPQP